MIDSGPVSVLTSIVTYNDAHFLQMCLERLENLPCRTRVKIFDNSFSECCVEVAKRFRVPLRRAPENAGFSRGHNENLAGEEFDFALLLNADVLLGFQYIDELIGLMSRHAEIGMAGGKLLRMSESGEPETGAGRPLVDSAGVYFTPWQRHLDRGSGEPDRGQYDTRQFVFGITGAALMCSRQMVEDLRKQGEFLDEDFFAYREDADLAWRAQLLGWKAAYLPSAVAQHCRQALPERRQALHPAINYHSLKNRYLMRWKNMDRAVFWKCFPYLWVRDLGIAGYVVGWERSSLGAYRQLRGLRAKYRQKRAIVQSMRRVSGAEIARWFNFRPTAEEF